MATGNSTANTRESRRRKIVDRGADRLALITGRIQSLPSSEPCDTLIADDSSSQPLNSSPQHQDQPVPTLSDQTIPVSSNGKDSAFDSTLLNYDSTTEAGHGGSSVEPSLPEFETAVEASIAPSLDTSSKVESSFATSADRNSTRSISGTEQHFELQTRIRSYVTPYQISSAIAATEKSRLVCSVTVAVLVVLSCLGFPVLGSNIMSSIISFRPLYLVLLTNLTLVVARLLFNNQRRFERAVQAENNIPSSGRYDWAEQASSALEVGLVIQKAIDAAFMDCSVYAVIIVCCLSFLS